MINRGEVPEGYKKTKVGIVPVDWEVGKFNKFFKVNQGLQIPILKRFKEQGENRYVYITNEFINNEKTGVKEKYFIEDPSENVICTEDDILMTRTGNTGIVLTNVRGVFHNNFFKIKYSKNELDKRYLLYYLNSSYTQKMINIYAGTSTISDLNHSDFYRIYFIKPNYNEQQKIAKIISTWEKAIELKEKLIEQKQEQKKGLVQKLLTGKVRIPGFGEEWKEVRLSKLLHYEQPNKYLVNEILEYNESMTPVLTANKSFVLGSTLDEEGIYNNLPVIIFDDFTTDNKYVNFPFKIKSSAIKLLKPKTSNANLKFVYEAIQLINLPLGGHKRYYISEYQHIKVKIPSIQEQEAIANILSTADQEIELLKEQLEHLKTQKKGLMQLLLTGKIRVVDKE